MPIILDSRTSDNAANDERFVNYIVEIEPLTVELSSCITAAAYRRGYVKFDIGVKTLRLCRVYLIPEIKLNVL